LYRFVENAATWALDPDGEAVFYRPNSDSGHGDHGLNMWVNPPAYGVGRPAPNPCTRLGETRNRKPSSKTVDCPCSGTQVPCTDYEECTFYSMSRNGVQFNWTTKTDCTCPEYK
jgi:hypothetical protein